MLIRSPSITFSWWIQFLRHKDDLQQRALVCGVNIRPQETAVHTAASQNKCTDADTWACRRPSDQVQPMGSLRMDPFQDAGRAARCAAAEDFRFCEKIH